LTFIEDEKEDICLFKKEQNKKYSNEKKFGHFVFQFF
jgi:hypothetical protein